MKELKQAIENTLINSLKPDHAETHEIVQSIETCVDYISKEIEQLLFDFGNEVEDILLNNQNITSMKGLLDQFLTERYKDKV